MIARVEPGYLDVDFADAEPGKVLNLAGHMRTQIFNRRSERRRENQTEVQMENSYLPVQLALSLRA